MSRNIPDKEMKALIALSGGVCAFPGCNKRLLEQGNADDDAAFLGEMAHIIADSRQGPRGISLMSDDDRDKHTNLVLLCGDHHTIIDAQPRTYSIAVLRRIKEDHEGRIHRATSGPGPFPGRPILFQGSQFMREVTWEACVHEAGHVIVGLATGYKVRSVSVEGETGRVHFEPQPVGISLGLSGLSVPGCRRSLLGDVAGFLAEALYAELQRHGRFLTQIQRASEVAVAAEEQRFLSECGPNLANGICPLRVSDFLRLGYEGADPNGDISIVHAHAGQLALVVQWKARTVAMIATDSPSDLLDIAFVSGPIEMMTEVLRAERKAERILKRNWPALERLASSLFRRRSHRITGRRVAALLGPVK
jgi:hypothetical protein